ncbi:MAG: tetratricopeptide repeat protein, partial [bacterium]
MRQLAVSMALVVAVAGAAPAQQAATQPTEKVLVLPLAAAAQDSATSIALADAVRGRIAQLARYRVAVVPKPKLCEALAASGFPCDGLLDEQQARQLARFLQVEAYVTGLLQRAGSTLTAHVRVLDIGSSGMAASFTVTNGNPGTTQALAEAIAQRLNTIIRASEQVRECTQSRQRGQFQRALSAAQKALAVDPTSAGAHLCVATVYEAQRMPVDSIIAASQRALKGDSLNATAWENIARGFQHKADTLSAIDAFIHQLQGEPRNTAKRLGIAQLLRQMRQYQRAVDLLEEGLIVARSDPQLIELKTRICIDGSLYRCAVAGMLVQVDRDSALLRDTTFLRSAIGAAQQASDTQALLTFSGAAIRNYANDASFWKARGAAWELAGNPDSAVAAYVKSLAINPSDMNSTLLVAKALVDGANYDTVAVRNCRGDTVCVRPIRDRFVAQFDAAKSYVDRAVGSADTAALVTAAALMRTAGEKLARAGASDAAYR